MAKTISFINPNASPLSPPTKIDVFVEICKKTWALALLFVLITFACATLYYIGSSHGWGIQATFTADCTKSISKDVEFFDCLHFSMVTIATLGYGDYRPQSWGRLVAGVEVFSGIILMGVFVSRLISGQQDRLLKRAVGGLLNTEIQDFRDQISELMGSLGNSPAVSPAQSSDWLYRAAGLAQSLARYWRYEVSRPDLYEVLPARAAGRLVGDIVSLLEGTEGYLHGKDRSSVHADDVIKLRNLTESCLAIAVVLSNPNADKGHAHTFSRIEALITAFRERFKLLQP